MAAYDSIIIGAGAAGLYAALHAGKRGRRVLVLEHNREAGAKILISGGGRCNFTNLHCAPDRFISANPHFARSALARHTQHDVIALVRKHGVNFYEKTLGQLFCEGARLSQKIVRMLLEECAAYGVSIELGCAVRSVTKLERFRVETSAGSFEGETLCIATGGLSIPKLGASGFAFEIATQFGVPLRPRRPGLVPLTFSEADLAWMRALSGVSTEVVATAGKIAFREAALFTHRGLSGPAILQISSYLDAPGQTFTVDWAPDAAGDFLLAAKRARPQALAKTIVAQHMPERLATALCAAYAPRALGDTKDEALLTMTRHALKSAVLTPTGDEGYAKAEVTVGGVDTAALSQQTMEVRSLRGLFFIGEAVDVTGWLGGYNFQWAWSSGWAAGQAL